jgi:hypothetical protein
MKELLEIYEIKLIASYEKSLGQSLLGNEISSLAYWNFYDKNKEGYMAFKKFVDFLKVEKIYKKLFDLFLIINVFKDVQTIIDL